MKHYDHFEWVLYKEDLLDELIKREMQEHLLECEECMNIFIRLIDEKDIEDASGKISIDFTENLMDKVDEIQETKESKVLKFENKNISRNKKNIFIQYIAVASITIVLTASGIFDRAIASPKNIDIPIKEEQSITGKLYDLSEKITKDFSESFNSFNIMNMFSNSKEE